MLAAAPAGSETYLIATPALLAALPRALAAPPLELLGVTATLYLRPYLTASEHRAAMSAAYQRARAEAASWGEPSGVPAQPSSSLAFWNADRSELYLKIWRRAIAGGTAAHVLLAQHACEIAELLDRPALPVALRLGLLLPLAGPTDLPEGPFTSMSAVPPDRPDLPKPNDEPIELLSRALLSRAIGRTTFVDNLLVLHAGNRGTELTGGWVGPRALAEQLVAGLPICDRAPNRLRAVQPHELARRAVASGSSRAALAVEAGLAEAERLANGRRLLLLAALDRAVTGNENNNDRS